MPKQARKTVRDRVGDRRTKCVAARKTLNEATKDRQWAEDARSTLFRQYLTALSREGKALQFEAEAAEAAHAAAKDFLAAAAVKARIEFGSTMMALDPVFAAAIRDAEETAAALGEVQGRLVGWSLEHESIRA
jgi:hypothetical protein